MLTLKLQPAADTCTSLKDKLYYWVFDMGKTHANVKAI